MGRSGAAGDSRWDNPALYASEDAFAERSYWDARYKREPTTHEWYRGYESLAPVLTQHLPRDGHILQLGVGTSRLQVDMADAGFARITSVDYSQTAIARLNRLYPGYEGRLDFQVADCRSMPQFADRSFAGVLDKGTLDALLCGDSADAEAAALLAEAWRVLQPGGAYVWVTSGSPRARLRYLQSPATPWAQLLAHEVGQAGAARGPLDCSSGAQAQLGEAQLPYSHWVYCCRKAAAPAV